MRRICTWLVCAFIAGCTQPGPTIRLEMLPKSRVVLLTDILNEADDSQTLVRFLMYANKMDIEGLIAQSSCHQYLGKHDPDPVRNTVHPEEIRKFIRAYHEVRPNLLLHEAGWPEAEALLAVTGASPQEFGTRGIGPGRSTSGSQILAEAIKKEDERPLYVIINAGASCLAQAILDLEAELPQEEVARLLQNVRVCDNAGQDNSGAWITHRYPDIWYKRSAQQVYQFMNQEGPAVWDTSSYPGLAQHQWAAREVQNNHGALGALYPIRKKWKDPSTWHTLEGGGSGNFIGFVNHGLFHPEKLHWGGWGGRFDTVKALNIPAAQLKWAEPELLHSEDEYQPYEMYPQAAETWIDPITGMTYEGVGVPIYRWRRAYHADFEARMDWCVSGVGQANHPPTAVVAGDSSDAFVWMWASPGEQIQVDASPSFDVDADELSWTWYLYPEAGQYSGDLPLRVGPMGELAFTAPEAPVGTEIHLILELLDDGLPQLRDYRRIILRIGAP